ncbi:TPA: tail fiber assembly protein [Escherichia coli]|nr:tail fiber assembly protein [Escherichia coli]
MIFFSETTIGFYEKSLFKRYEDAGSLPDDIIEVDNATYEMYSSSPPLGMMLGSKEGMPAWVKPPAKTKEELSAEALEMKNNLILKANGEIAWRQDAVDAGIATSSESDELKEWKKYRISLMRFDIYNASEVNWPPTP